jgi:hypothetical protein
LCDVNRPFKLVKEVYDAFLTGIGLYSFRHLAVFKSRHFHRIRAAIDDRQAVLEAPGRSTDAYLYKENTIKASESAARFKKTLMLIFRSNI